ncbi:MAG: hypothetical protein NY202_05815 [Mollicutes bacterium UO1]
MEGAMQRVEERARQGISREEAAGLEAARLLTEGVGCAFRGIFRIFAGVSGRLYLLLNKKFNENTA